MSKARIRNLTIIAMAGAIIAIALIVYGIIGGVYTQDALGTHVTSFGHPLTFGIGIVLAALSVLIAAIAWVAALIHTAQRQQWAWFVLMLVFGSWVVLVWSLFGPDAPLAPPQRLSSSSHFS